MSPQEAIAYIESYHWNTTKLGLERTRSLLQALEILKKSSSLSMWQEATERVAPVLC